MSPPWSRSSIVQTAEALAATSQACKSYIRYEDFRPSDFVRPLFFKLRGPPLNSETGGLESSGQRPISAINKTKRIAFFSPVIFFSSTISDLKKKLFFQFFGISRFLRFFKDFYVILLCRFLEFYYLSFFFEIFGLSFFSLDFP